MSSEALVQFLTQATGLARKEVIQLYNAGYPWPLWTAHDVRKAGILAQAKGLPFPAALEEAEAIGEAMDETLFATIRAADRTNGVTMTKRVQAMLSLPWFKEPNDHIEQVSARTLAAPQTVYLFSMALQHYAIMTPGFKLINAFPHRKLFLC